MNSRLPLESELITRKIGIEFEIPVTCRDYFAAQFHETGNLFNQLILQGWNGKFDPATGALIGVKRDLDYP